MPRLENWATIMPDDEKSRYTAPELRGLYLCGSIYDDERFKDGTNVRTSKVFEIDIENNFAKTRNTTYILGVPDKCFKEMYIDRIKNEL